RAIAGGCVFAEVPERGAGEARLFWDAASDPMTIRATASRCGSDDPDAFDIRRLSLPASLLKDDRGEELAIRCGDLTVRISIEVGTLLEGSVRLDYRLGGCRLARPLLALGQYDAMLRLGRIPPALRGTARAVDRPALVLRTLDALAADVGARRIAIALFGEEEVAASWEHPSDYLRMRTRRLIARARQLAGGGYLDLLT
ncbi:DNA -binding domain-containing protein, partial [Sphingomonas adhaesiva]|uniref:DNA -binding domain-containing protein n=1 Tax=Sphingomonas adhaesiva TaxID=28212 RepID=UPI002FF8780C